MADAFWVYIVTNKTQTTLYIGMTNDLVRRLWEHQHPEDPKSFTARYSTNRLVWFESFPTAAEAIAVEKRLKGWTRAKKETLIREKNPHWDDLGAELD